MILEKIPESTHNWRPPHTLSVYFPDYQGPFNREPFDPAEYRQHLMYKETSQAFEPLQEAIRFLDTKVRKNLLSHPNQLAGQFNPELIMITLIIKDCRSFMDWVIKQPGYALASKCSPETRQYLRESLDPKTIAALIYNDFPRFFHDKCADLYRKSQRRSGNASSFIPIDIMTPWKIQGESYANLWKENLTFPLKDITHTSLDLYKNKPLPLEHSNSMTSGEDLTLTKNNLAQEAKRFGDNRKSIAKEKLRTTISLVEAMIPSEAIKRELMSFYKSSPRVGDSLVQP